MTLHQKIRTLYPSLISEDFVDTLILQNDSDGRGPYIKSWNHPTLTKPTQEELDNV